MCSPMTDYINMSCGRNTLHSEVGALSPGSKKYKLKVFKTAQKENLPRPTLLEMDCSGGITRVNGSL